jgi:hypothetical protein
MQSARHETVAGADAIFNPLALRRANQLLLLERFDASVDLGLIAFIHFFAIFRALSFVARKHRHGGRTNEREQNCCDGFLHNNLLTMGNVVDLWHRYQPYSRRKNRAYARFSRIINALKQRRVFEHAAPGGLLCRL